MKKRLDQHLVDKGLAPSKTKAQEMIAAGQVEIFNDTAQSYKIEKKPAKKIEDSLVVRIAAENVLKYVSRSGFKLEGALAEFAISANGIKALDVGQSTGGFTDCLLQHGAQHVTGIDIGKDELAQSIAADARVRAITGAHVLQLPQILDPNKNQFDLIVIDLSFISLTKILHIVLPYLRSGGLLLALVKPQFEVGIAHIAKGGIVKSEQALKELEIKMIELAQNLNLDRVQYRPAHLKGRDGNQEFFLYATKT